MGILRRGLWRVRRDSHLPFFCSGYFAAFAFFSNFRAAELMQTLWPVGFRPSSKTCLGCASRVGRRLRFASYRGSCRSATRLYRARSAGSSWASQNRSDILRRRRFAAADALVGPSSSVFSYSPVKGGSVPSRARHVVLILSELFLPFRIGLLKFLAHDGRLHEFGRRRNSSLGDPAANAGGHLSADLFCGTLKN